MPQTTDKSPAKPGSRNRDADSNDTDTRGVEGDFLIDVTEMGDDVGLELPAAMTVAARAACAAWSHAGKHSESSDYRSFRLWDVLGMLASAVCSTGVANPHLLINLQRIASDEFDTNNQKLALKLIFDTKDNGDPFTIIMLPEQE